MENIPKDVILLNRLFKDNNFQLLIVGGAVRDFIMGEPPKDYDLVTNAHPTEVTQLLKQCNDVSKVIDVGKSFGVIVAVVNGVEYEIATFRGESGYTDGRHPDNVTFGDIHLDKSRRDLTINALYYDINTHEIVDLVGGVNDIKNGIVRTVGVANDRFGEDRLRVLRAIRFAARFGTQLSDDIKASLKNDNNLAGVSPERIRDEFLKGIKTAKSVNYFLRLIDTYGLFEFIFPGLRIDKTKFIETKDYKPLIALLLLDNNDAGFVKQTLNKATYTSDEVKGIGFLLTLNKFTPELVYQFSKELQNVKLTYDEIMLFSRKSGLNLDLIKALLNFKLSVTGADLIKQGFKPGPKMGDEIKRLEVENFKETL